MKTKQLKAMEIIEFWRLIEFFEPKKRFQYKTWKIEKYSYQKWKS